MSIINNRQGNERDASNYGFFPVCRKFEVESSRRKATESDNISAATSSNVSLATLRVLFHSFT